MKTNNFEILDELKNILIRGVLITGAINKLIIQKRNDAQEIDIQEKVTNPGDFLADYFSEEKDMRFVKVTNPNGEYLMFEIVDPLDTSNLKKHYIIETEEGPVLTHWNTISVQVNGYKYKMKSSDVSKTTIFKHKNGYSTNRRINSILDKNFVCYEFMFLTNLDKTIESIIEEDSEHITIQYDIDRGFSTVIPDKAIESGYHNKTNKYLRLKR